MHRRRASSHLATATPWCDIARDDPRDGGCIAWRDRVTPYDHLTARPPHRVWFPTQGAPRSAATPGLWSVTPSAYSEARHDIGAFSRKEAVPAHLAVALAGRLFTCALFFTAKRLHSAAHGLLRSSAPRGSVPIFARYAEGVSQRDTVGAARSETDTLTPASRSRCGRVTVDGARDASV